jgi:hypothetical protein
LEDFEELEEDINNLGDDCLQPYLTRQDYEKSLKYRSIDLKITRTTVFLKI